MKTKSFFVCLILIFICPFIAGCKSQPPADTTDDSGPNPGDNSTALRSLTVAKVNDSLYFTDNINGQYNIYKINLAEKSLDSAQIVLENAQIIKQYDNYLTVKENDKLCCYELNSFNKITEIEYTPAAEIINDTLSYINFSDNALNFINLTTLEKTTISDFDADTLVLTDSNLYVTASLDEKTLVYPITDTKLGQTIESDEYSYLFTVSSNYIYYFTGTANDYQLVRKNLETSETEVLFDEIAVPRGIQTACNIVYAELTTKDSLTHIYSFNTAQPDSQFEQIVTDNVKFGTLQAYDLGGIPAISYACESRGAKVYYEGSNIELTDADQTFGSEGIYADKKAIAFSGSEISVLDLETAQVNIIK